MISAKIIKDSMNPAGVRLTSAILTFPKYLNGEINTHRMLSKSASSSRAIPIKKFLADVGTNPVLPVTWPRNQSGMQAEFDLNENEARDARNMILGLRKAAQATVVTLEKIGLHKQCSNRYLEPWSYMTMLVTGTDWDNFFALRVHKMAQPDFARCAYLLAKEMLRSVPEQLYEGQWHCPFSEELPGFTTLPDHDILKACIGRCARVSYKNQNGEYSVSDDIALYNRLISQWPKHMGPFEHVAMARDDESFTAPMLHDDTILNIGLASHTTSNFRGWTQYRKMMRDENVTKLDLAKHVAEYEKEMGITPNDHVPVPSDS